MIQDLPDEIWEPISGYENLYSVSNKGRVKAHSKQWVWGQGKGIRTVEKEDHIMAHSITNGYYRLSLCKNGTVVLKTVHRLVATAFKPNPENKPQVNHIDTNKLNNNDWNLEWVTSSENCQHALENGLGPIGINHPKATKIKCDTLDICFTSITQAKNELGVNNIGAVCRGKRTHTEGLSFRYL